MSVSDDRNDRDQNRKDARIALVENIKHDSVERGLSNTEIAEKHQISENTVRSLLSGADVTDAEVYKVVLTQLGTNNSTVVTVVAPKGMTYREVVERFRKNS